jgi:hypothetical protein
MKQIILAAACLLLASTARAEIIIEQIGIPIVGASGTLWTITLGSTDPGEIIFGVDATFIGNLHQVYPLGMETPFNNLNGFFGADDVSKDSQFLFQSTDFVPLPSNISDTTSRLSASMTNLPGATLGDGLIVPLAQISLSPGATICYFFDIDVRDPTRQPIANVELGSLLDCVPESTSLGLAALAMVGFAGSRRR